jgi:enoyl-CoA hydratase/carnithine racemase
MPHLKLSYPRPDIAVLTLNRLEKLNALSYELVQD